MGLAYFPCNCSSEILVVQREEDLYYIAVYKHYNQGFMGRLKHIWHILKYGTPWHDQLVYAKEDLQKIKMYLDKELSN